MNRRRRKKAWKKYFHAPMRLGKREWLRALHASGMCHRIRES
jgi:hypothetical protein